MLAVENLGKRYDGRWIVRGMTFRLNLGDCMVVTGRNGSGKSTLLRLIAGLVRPSAGTVTLPGGDPRTTLGLSAIEQALYPQLTVEEHLQLAGELRGCDDRRNELLDLIGLSSAASVTAAHLSTGMKARLKLALAIQARPLLLLLDEPGAGLDDEGRELVAGVVDEQIRRGCLLLATNDPDERRFANAELELER